MVGAPDDRFLSNAFRRCFRLSGVLSELCRLILGCAKKFLTLRIFSGNLRILDFIRAFLSILENLWSYRLSENDSRPCVGTQNGISRNFSR